MQKATNERTKGKDDMNNGTKDGLYGASGAAGGGDKGSKPTFIERLMNRRGVGDADAYVVSGEPARVLPVDEARVQKWIAELTRYRSAKETLEARVRDNYDWWKLRHWQKIRKNVAGDPEPASAYLVNTILSKHAARMDSYPEAVCLPREESDKAEATALTQILPCIFRLCDFEKAYSDAGWDKNIGGCGIYSVTWDPSAHGGLGEVAVNAVDILNMFWEPGVEDIQKSKYIFCCQEYDRDELISMYPDKLSDGRLRSGRSISLRHYDSDARRTGAGMADKAVVVDVYYKVRTGGRTVLHFAKFVDTTVLYATENDPRAAERGLYDHGKYPFVFEPLFPEKDSPAGFAYVDICKEPQKYIDIMGNAMLKNIIESSTPRYFVRKNAGVNKEEFSDMTKRCVTVDGNLGEEDIRVIDTKGLDGNAVSYYQLKVDEMKETAGNRDVNNGGSAPGVTAATAIAQLKEAGNALSRDENGAAWRAFREIVNLVIELIRQFYDLPRCFRIVGERGAEEFVKYSNMSLRTQSSIGMDGKEVLRRPEFDIDVSCQDESEYNTQVYNNLALQFFGLGFFRPDMAEQALLTLDMMDFKGKDELIRRIEAQSELRRQLELYRQLALTLSAKYEPGMYAGLAAAAANADGASAAPGGSQSGAQGSTKQGSAGGTAIKMQNTSAGAGARSGSPAAPGAGTGNTGADRRVEAARESARDGARPSR